MMKSKIFIFFYLIVSNFLFAQEFTMELNGTSTTQDDITVSYSEGYFKNTSDTLDKKTIIELYSNHPYASNINGGNDYLDISIAPATYIDSITVAYEVNVLDLVLQFMKDESVVKEVSGFAGSTLKENTTYSVGTIANVIRLYDTGRSNRGGFELSHIIFDSSMPVELTSFTASVIEEGVLLNWETATEINNYGFDIERSVIGDQLSEWESITFVEGHGNSNSPKSYEYVDTDVPEGTVEYRLKQIDTDGQFEYYNQTAKVDINITDMNGNKELPSEFVLEQNYPNPFNPTTVISYQLSAISKVQLKVFDVLGKEVATLVNKEQAAGNYSINVNAGNLPSGMYIYKLTAGEFIQSRKMLLLR